MSALLKVQNITKNFHTKSGETQALSNISFDIHEGDFVSIVGPSGCGKSTILSIISGLLPPSSGKILLREKPISTISEEIGYMFQEDYLFEWRNVLRNIYLGLEIQNKLTEENKSFVDELINLYGLSQFKKHHPSQLSGGMRQRVALIRTLAINPSLLLLDEPFSALDYQTRLSVCDDVYRILKNQGKTAILVTHDISEAVSMSDKVIVLSNRPATIKEIIDVTFEQRTSPLASRQDPKFRAYFDQLWKELNI